MPLKFCANLSWMFIEAGTLENRYEAAKAAGFQSVECTFPYHIEPDVLAKAREASGINHIVIYAWPGDQSKGDYGLAALPHREAEFMSGLEKSIEYAKALNCKRIHIPAGRKPEKWDDAAMEEVLLENMKHAAKRMEQEGMIGLIEPMNTATVPNYVLDNPDKCVELLKKVKSPSLKLQLDIFHLQMTSGNLSANIKKYLPYTGHIQVAQVPGREEPSAEGEIHYPYVFKVLEKENYDGYIGLEYKPSGSTSDSLKWIKHWGLHTTMAAVSSTPKGARASIKRVFSRTDKTDKVNGHSKAENKAT